MAARGWSVERLRKASGIDCTRVSLQRKLFGYPSDDGWAFQSLTFEEVEMLGRPLGLIFEVRAS